MKSWTRWLLTFVSILLLATTACSPAVKDVQIDSDASYGKAVDGDAGDALEPVVDILFVIDDSGSMGTHQTNLANNISRFVGEFFKNIVINFHIGVLTTDTTNRGALLGLPSFIDRSTPDFANELARRMVVGTGGDVIEAVFDPIKDALSEPMVSTANAGFYRSGAYLAIIVITDAEDQSRRNSAASLQTYLESTKVRKDFILSYGAIIPSGVTNCPRDEFRDPVRLETFLKFSPSAGSNVFSLCDVDFGSKLAGLGKDIADRIGSVFLLPKIPLVETIQLRYGSQIIEPNVRTGWSFDPALNAIRLGPEFVLTKQPAGTKMRIKYDSTEFGKLPK